jgi:hypothetical protein
MRNRSGDGSTTKGGAAHQPDQGVFELLLSEDISWEAFVAFPPSVRLAVIVGQPLGSRPSHDQCPSTPRR